MEVDQALAFDSLMVEVSWAVAASEPFQVVDRIDLAEVASCREAVPSSVVQP